MSRFRHQISRHDHLTPTCDLRCEGRGCMSPSTVGGVLITASFLLSFLTDISPITFPVWFTYGLSQSCARYTFRTCRQARNPFRRSYTTNIEEYPCSHPSVRAPLPGLPHTAYTIRGKPSAELLPLRPRFHGAPLPAPRGRVSRTVPSSSMRLPWCFRRSENYALVENGKPPRRFPDTPASEFFPDPLSCDL